MKYINDKTKAIIDTDLVIGGGYWRLLEDSPEEKEKSKAKRPKNTKAQVKKGDE